MLARSALNPGSLNSRFGDGPDGRRQIGSTPAGGDADSTERPANHRNRRPATGPDEARRHRSGTTTPFDAGDAEACSCHDTPPDRPMRSSQPQRSAHLPALYRACAGGPGAPRAKGDVIARRLRRRTEPPRSIRHSDHAGGHRGADYARANALDPPQTPAKRRSRPHRRTRPCCSPKARLSRRSGRRRGYIGRLKTEPLGGLSPRPSRGTWRRATASSPTRSRAPRPCERRKRSSASCQLSARSETAGLCAQRRVPASKGERAPDSMRAHAPGARLRESDTRCTGLDTNRPGTTRRQFGLTNSAVVSLD